jgi:hypothetical protein
MTYVTKFDSKLYYTVATDIDDCIVLKLCDDYYTSVSLTMNQNETLELIRMLTMAIAENPHIK